MGWKAGTDAVSQVIRSAKLFRETRPPVNLGRSLKVDNFELANNNKINNSSGQQNRQRSVEVSLSETLHQGFLSTYFDAAIDHVDFSPSHRVQLTAKVRDAPTLLAGLDTRHSATKIIGRESSHEPHRFT
ncbi:MAG: hypothetical protein AB8B91_18825 [Rubripirellula sp.]